MDDFRLTVPFAPMAGVSNPPSHSDAPGFLCPWCGEATPTPRCRRDGRRAWLLGPSTAAPPRPGSALNTQWLCRNAQPAAAKSWLVALAAPQPSARLPSGAAVSPTHAQADPLGLPRQNLQGQFAAAPCLAELAPAYGQWAGLYDFLQQHFVPGIAAAVEPQTGPGGWLTACDLGSGRRLSELMTPHGEIRGVGQRQTAHALAAAAEILVRLHALGQCHGQLSLHTVTLQGGPTGQPIYQLLPPPLPPLPAQALADYHSPWQLACLAPELLQGALPTPQADVFALGAMGFLLATGRPPFGELEQPRSMIAGARSGRTPMLRLWLPEATQEFVEPLTRALAPDPARRPSVAEFAAAMVMAERSSRRAFAQTGAKPAGAPRPGTPRDTGTDLGHALAQRTAVEPMFAEASRQKFLRLSMFPTGRPGPGLS